MELTGTEVVGAKDEENVREEQAGESSEEELENPSGEDDDEDEEQEEEPRTFMQYDFGLDRRLIKAVAKMGFVYPTLVQDKCIPLALMGKDLLVRARTGSGKTAAFALPLLQKILRRKESEPGLARGVRALILVPTRELCNQARLNLLEMMHYCRDCVSLLALVDDNMSAQQAALRDMPDILVATPARLVAHLKEENVELEDSQIVLAMDPLVDMDRKRNHHLYKALSEDGRVSKNRTLSKAVETLVVDEADLVLSFGYSEDIRTITARLPKICQGFLMSATLSPELEDLKRVVLHRPAVLKLEEGTRDGHLLQFYLPLQQKDDKFLVVFSFIKLGLLEGKGLFFVNQTDSSYRLKLFLEQFHIRSAVLNAELPLNSRLHILQEFNRGVFDYLIVTDSSMDVVGMCAPKKDQPKAKVLASGDVEATDARKDTKDLQDGKGRAEETKDEDESNEDDDAKKRKVEQIAGEDGMDHDEDDEEREGNDEDEDEPHERPPASLKLKKSDREDSEFGAARGVDFRDVSFVLNVDFPPSASSYTHRVGRTARAGASGTALSLVVPKDEAELRTLRDVQASQPGLAPPSLDDGSNPCDLPGRKSIVAAMGAEGAGERAGVGGGETMGAVLTPQPAPLAFDIREIERFRYRVEDILKKVTRVRVREAKAAELKAEMLNSKKLSTYFEENAGDLRVLRHDKSVLHPLQKLDHLKHIPDYLMPVGMQTGEDPTQHQRKKMRRVRGGLKRRSGYGQDQSRRKDNDPLQTFEASGDTGGNPVEETPEQVAKRMNDERKSRVYRMGSYTGVSTAGRRRWQERRGKGKFGGAKRKPKKTGTRFDLPV